MVQICSLGSLPGVACSDLMAPAAALGSLEADLSALVTVVLVSSPCSSHPHTSLVSTSLSSISVLDRSLSPCPVVVILDGFVVRERPRPKKGQITADMACAYAKYHGNLLEMYGQSPRVHILRSPEHLGFAMCVRLGLIQAKTPYALVAQHDRSFMGSFPNVQHVLSAMERDPSIRYVGFPTVMNRTHASVVRDRYRLTCLVEASSKIPLPEVPGTCLHPLVFWFDSQHLCHVARYLQIYRPSDNLPPDLRKWLGLGFIKDMVLRKGDFIEDRVGQAQRRALTQQGLSRERVLRLFRWFGTYLLWIPEGSPGRNETSQVLVRHLRGRQTNPEKISQLKQNYAAMCAAGISGAAAGRGGKCGGGSRLEVYGAVKDSFESSPQGGSGDAQSQEGEELEDVAAVT